MSAPATGGNTYIETVLSGWVVRLHLTPTPTVSLGSQSHWKKCPRVKRICIFHTSSWTTTESWPPLNRNLSTAKYKYMSASKIRGCCFMHAVKEWITQSMSGQQDPPTGWLSNLAWERQTGFVLQRPYQQWTFCHSNDTEAWFFDYTFEIFYYRNIVCDDWVWGLFLQSVH